MNKTKMAIASTDSFFDNTMLSGYKECPRKYFLRHILNWRSAGVATPLVFGLSWHSAMDIVWQLHNKVNDTNELVMLAMAKFLETWEGEGLPAQLDLEQTEKFAPRTPSIAAEMLHGYITKRATILSSAELVACEQPFAVPLPNTEHTWYIGRLDKVIKTEQILALEHKTTTAYKKDGGFQTSYIEGWYSDSQVKGYQFGGGLYYPGLTQVWIDAALVHKQRHDEFRFVPVAHQFPLLEEFLADTKEWVNRIELDTQAYKAAGGRLAPGVFPKNEQSCHGKFGPCSFLNICRTTPRPELLDSVPEGYKEESWSPFETLGLSELINKGCS